MRVLHVLEAMGGGTKKHVQLLTRGLKARGLEIVLALPFPQPFDPRSALMDYSFPDFMRSQGVRVEQFHMIHGRISPGSDWMALRELVGSLRREHFDIVHTHSAKAGVLGRVAARLAGVPAVIHTPYSLPFRRELRQGNRYWFYYLIEWMLGQWTDVMIATSRAEYQEIATSGIMTTERISLIPNCFDLEQYEWAFEQRMASKRSLGWAENHPVVGTVARLSPQKGIQTLVKSARLVRAQIPNVRFVIVGEGELREEIERHVQALGLGGTWVMVGKRDDYLQFIRAFDVFAFPSLWEGLPYAPIEAMAVGTPVVATSVVGTTDLVTNEDTGLLVSAQDETAMSQAIVRVLTDAGLAKKLSVRGRRFIEANFDSERPVNQTLAVYRQVLERRQAGGRGKQV